MTNFDSEQLHEGEVIESPKMQSPPQTENHNFPGTLTTPLSLRGIPPWLIYLAAGLSVVYMINPTAGFIEFIPDNLPIIGNLDEGAAMLMIWYGLLEIFEGKNYSPDSNFDDQS